MKNMLWLLICPVESVDRESESLLNDWHAKDDNGEYLYPDYKKYFGCKMQDLRAKYPIFVSSSKDKISRALLIVKHRVPKFDMEWKKEKICRDLGPNYRNDVIRSIIVNPEDSWKTQLLRDRFWWTISERCPYTHLLTGLKWGTEIVIIGGCAYATYQLIKRYRNRKQSESTDAQQN